MNRYRVLIATVGLSKEPIEFSAQKYQPENIYLICTNESLTNANALKNKLSQNSICKINVVPNGAESSHIMKQIYKITKELSPSGIQINEVIVDGTGGTKPMSAGAMIAAATLGLTNVYVDVSRDKDGNVLPQTMKVYELPDPHEVLAEYYAEVGVQELNRYEFTSAKTVFNRLCEETSNLTRRKLWEALTQLSEALDASDKFNHQDALTKLEKTLESLNDYQRESRIPACEQLLENLESYKNTLTKISAPTSIFERVANLFVNAKMRLSSGKYDDAVARYYRSLEALAQCALQIDCGYTENQIKEERLSLDKSYEILLNKNHPLGLKYKEDGPRFRGNLESRNTSILAHGWRPVKEETAKKFADFTEDYLKSYCESKNIDYKQILLEQVFPTLPPIRNLLYS